MRYREVANREVADPVSVGMHLGGRAARKAAIPATAARAASPATAARAAIPGTRVVGLTARAGRVAARRLLPAARAIYLAATYRRRKGSHPSTSMADQAAMAVAGGHANRKAPVPHAAGGVEPDVERSTDPEVLRQFRPSGVFYAHVGPTDVVDGVPVIAKHGLHGICIRNRARAHTRRLHGRLKALPVFVDLLTENGSPSHAGDRVAKFHGDSFFGNQGPQRRIYEVMSFCNEVMRYQVPLHPFHRFVYTSALLFPVWGTETFEAAANSFGCLLRNWPKAVFVSRPVATDLAVPIGHDAGLVEYLDQLTLVAAEENDVVDEDLSPRMSEFPNPFLVPMFATDHRRAADTRFFRGRGLLPTEWSASFLRAPKSFELSR